MTRPKMLLIALALACVVLTIINASWLAASRAASWC